ncbi:MAG TPA: efflux transporter outer membrane subunit [Rhizomicrobium sp.]|jgi:NodT family efflux transporter outer membrane factor (OMF) lipoprotein|nr:efflux transporter outer membrane subunit [Rhizomicrobium sp.]
MKRALTFVALIVAGCEVGPDYKPPPIATPPAFSELPATPAAGRAADEASLSQWWTRIDDPELQSLIARALASNLDLKSAVSRIRQAREQAIIAGAKEWPQLNANGTGVNLHANSSPLAAIAGGSGGQGQAPPSGPSNIKIYSVGIDATWEIDVFGGVRRGIEEAEANAEAASWTMHDAEVSLTAEVANDYLALRTAEARMAIVRNELARQQDALRLIAARRRAGFVTELDVNQQETLSSNTAAQLPPLAAEARVMEHAIAVLVGEQPEAIAKELDGSATFPAVRDDLAAGLPSDLLRRRPDIRAAERKLAAATAGIGVAVADLYPKFDLIGSASFVSNHLSNLISGNNFSTIGFGQITWPIFHAGQIRANIRVNEEMTEQAYLAYQSAVLKALQETEDALTRYANEEQRLAALEMSVNSAQSSAAIAAAQYRAGLVTYVNVLTAQSTLLSAEDQMAQSREAAAQDLVSLYKALGGGWSG